MLPSPGGEAARGGACCYRENMGRCAPAACGGGGGGGEAAEQRARPPRPARAFGCRPPTCFPHTSGRHRAGRFGGTRPASPRPPPRAATRHGPKARHGRAAAACGRTRPGGPLNARDFLKPATQGTFGNKTRKSETVSRAAGWGGGGGGGGEGGGGPGDTRATRERRKPSRGVARGGGTARGRRKEQGQPPRATPRDGPARDTQAGQRAGRGGDSPVEGDRRRPPRRPRAAARHGLKAEQARAAAGTGGVKSPQTGKKKGDPRPARRPAGRLRAVVVVAQPRTRERASARPAGPWSGAGA